MIVVLDTNLFLDIVDAEISERDVAAAVAKLADPVVAMVSPVTVLELVTNLRAGPSFARYRDACRAVVRLCRGALPDPEFLVRTRVLHLEGSPRFRPRDTWEVVEHVASLSSFEDAASYTASPSRPSERLDLDRLRAMRGACEAEWVARIERVRDWVLQQTGTQKMGGTTRVAAPGSRRDSFREFVDSPRFAAGLLELEARGYGAPDFSSLPEDTALLLRPLIDVVRTAIRGSVLNGRNTLRRKNDYNDLLLLLHLIDAESIFVSNEDFSDRMPSDAPYRDRVRSFAEWLRGATA